MKPKLTQLKTKSAKGVLSILTGGVVSKGVWAICGILISKIYGPENFGIYNVFLGYIGILSVIGTFRLEHILVITQNKNQVFNFFRFLLTISIGGTLLVLLVSYFISLFAGKSGGSLSMVIWILIGIGSLLSSWILIQNALFTKFKFFNAISWGLIVQTIFAVSFQLILYYAFPIEIGFYGLIIGYVIGTLASVIYYFIIVPGDSFSFQLEDAKKLVKKNADILKYAFPSESINTLANNLFIILAAIYYDKIEVGVFALALKILATPLTLLFNAFSKVYFQKSAQLFLQEKHKLLPLTLKVSLYSGWLNLLFLLIINTIGVKLLELFYHPEDWPDLKLYFLLISFWMLARSIVSPISPIALVINKNQLTLWLNVGLILANFIGIYWGISTNSFYNAILSFSISAGIMYLIYYVIILFQLDKLKNSTSFNNDKNAI